MIQGGFGGERVGSRWRLEPMCVGCYREVLAYHFLAVAPWVHVCTVSQINATIGTFLSDTYGAEPVAYYYIQGRKY